MCYMLGGSVKTAPVSEYGKTEVASGYRISIIFKNVSEKTICWMSHTDYISQVAPGFEITAHTADCPVATAGKCREEACMQSSSIRKYFIQSEGKTDAFQLRIRMSADVQETGRWMLS